MTFGALTLQARALRCLARREHSRRELERKLAPHAEDTPEASAAAQIAAVLDRLAERGLLSDARVAESVVIGQGARLGHRRLKQALQAKGLDAELVAATVQAARGTEFERARDLWRRRFGGAGPGSLAGAPADAAERLRQMRFLAGRGFDGEVIRRVVQAQGED